MSAGALKLCFVILLCTVFVQADVGQRYSGQRRQTLRLQRIESRPTPYPAAGYRPNREFNLPRDQPLFPQPNQQGSRPHVSSGVDNLSEPQKPQLTYGSPDQRPRFPQQTRPQSFNGFNSLAEPEFVEQTQFLGGNQQPRQPQNSNSGFNGLAQPQQPQFVDQSQFAFGYQPVQQSPNTNGDFNNGFNNLAEPQSPELLYGAPNNEEEEIQNGFDNLSEPQYNYNAPTSARLRQKLIARLQKAQRLQSQSPSQQQQFFTAPQNFYSAPVAQRLQQQRGARAQAVSQSRRLVSRKPSRLTDKREETEEEEADVKTSETVEDIETTTKAETKKIVNQNAAAGAAPTVVANTGAVSYYPAAAFSFVQPAFNGAYVAAPNYPTVQPVSAAYTVGSPFVSQQYTLATGAPAQLQAW